jgi:5-(carboxyamino)imidazole ribonucleotide synthase
MREFSSRAQTMISDLGYVGVIAFEVFDAQGEIWLNETAPRVHNSAHYSLDALSLDQFELHLRCILNLPLVAPQTLCPGFAMWNLLGQGEKQVQPLKLNAQISAGMRLHWYGKSETRPGRKMGHINSLGESPDAALEVAKHASARLGF